jgi:endonuclease/exonuclease/phosphatase family metal-dependent hydrolase
VVGLQEITLLRTQSPGDAAVGGTTPAADTLQDYLALLLDSLAAQGANYQVAAKVENWDLEMPRPNGDDARLTDYDVLLVRSEIPTSNAATGQYSTRLQIPLVTGQFVDINRGWAAIDAVIGTRTFRVVNTHLESDGVGIRLGQAVELTDMLASETGPILIIGDLNTDAILGTDPTYPQFMNKGYEDLWGANMGTGLTCCQSPLLDNASSTFAERIDFVLIRNVTIESVTGEVLGDEAADKTAGGLWPSDHGGVFIRATIR